MRGCIHFIIYSTTALLAVAALYLIVASWPLWFFGLRSAFNAVGRQAQLFQSLREPLEPRFDETAAERSAVTVTSYRGFLCPAVGQGTGFFLGNRTSIVTAWHVAEEAGDICQMSVTLINGETIGAQKWQRTQYADVALIKLLPTREEEKQLRLIAPLQVGDSATLRVGQPVWVIALNQGKLLAGRFMGSGPCGDTPNGLFFTCPVEPGDSGSPVLNTDGQVVGIVTKSAKVSASLLLGFFHYDGDGGCAVPVEYIR